jgi:hypothetical protein
MNRTRRVVRRNAVVERMDRRFWPIAVSVGYVALGLVYTFRWAPVVRHVPSVWLAPGDMLSTYGTAIEFAQGHFANVYQPGRGFLSYPGYLLALFPLAVFNNAFSGSWIDVKVHGHLVARPEVFLAPHLPSGFWYQGNLGPNNSHGIEQAIQPQAFPFLIAIALVYSCVALFACDALAERLQVEIRRRAVLAVAEAVVLWNVTIIFGHPEDALAVAFAIYAFLFAIDGRFVGASWLFGVALAFQPLALMTLPLLLVIGGRKRGVGMALRSVVPAAVLTVPEVAASVHNAVHALVKQPTFPDLYTAHQTPWTFLAPKLGGKGKGTMVGGGPPRIATIFVATAVAGWARRWRERPEMLAWALALVLSVRIFLETVIYSYYVWPALAVAMAVAARGSLRRFAIAITLAIGVTVVGQWHMGWLAWWTIDVAGIAGLLMAASRPRALEAEKRRSSSAPSRLPEVAKGRAVATKAKGSPAQSRPPAAAKGRAVATKTKGSPPRSRPPEAANVRAASATAKKKGKAPSAPTRRSAPR